MLRLFLIFAILTLAEPCFRGHHHHRCYSRFHRRKWNTVNSSEEETKKSTLNVQETPGTQLQAIQNELMQIEEKLQKYCIETSSVIAKELYGEDSYHLKYKLPIYVDPKVTVQIKNKLIHTVVTKKTDGNVTIFDGVTLLPDIVKPEDAKWTLHNKDVLKITIQYKVALGKEFVKDCGSVNKHVIDVPEVLYPKIIYKIKDAE